MLSIVATFAYGILAIIGGIIGYVQSQSKISLISGTISGLLLVIAGFLQVQGLEFAFVLASVITAVLVVIFAIRLKKTRKLMPAGLMTGLGMVTLVLILSRFLVR
ncbi:TMEM14 family protein [Calothrix sp. UHCC 0171]|uniref:TMEM14 family protein n=1 Tax=Calothrix sp. UHCC 0171 TaxID=3110245 RepID=UPI002B2053BE|nr:TMEM14 family protein [Calothrix sp. UHCC 0171]MEA5571400.1 TMEM14 family protein [Calothrix sp. UHCC 0171]